MGKQLPQGAPEKQILAGGRFIQGQNDGPRRQGGGKRHPLFFSFAQAIGRPHQQGLQLKQLHQFSDPGFIVALERLRSHDDFIPNRQLEKLAVGVLKGNPYIAGQL